MILIQHAPRNNDSVHHAPRFKVSKVILLNKLLTCRGSLYFRLIELANCKHNKCEKNSA